MTRLTSGHFHHNIRHYNGRDDRRYNAWCRFTVALLTLRVSTVAAAIAARGVFELPAALRAFAYQAAHFGLGFNGGFYHLPFRFG